MNADEAQTRLDDTLGGLATAVDAGDPPTVIGPDRQACLDTAQQDTGQVLVTTMWGYGADAGGPDLIERAGTWLGDNGFTVRTINANEVTGAQDGLTVTAKRQANGVIIRGTTDCVPKT